MNIRKLRLQRGWSQDQLAQLTGLNIRTIQRIERGQRPSLESLTALAAVFELDPAHLQPSEENAQPSPAEQEEQLVMARVRDIKGFYAHLIKYAIVMAMLFAINLLTNPGYIWAWWPMLGWGIGVISHGLTVFEVVNVFGPEWEKKQIEKRLGRKL